MSIEEQIIRLNILPYQVDEVIPSPLKFNLGQQIRIFKIKGYRTSKWTVEVNAGMFYYEGNENLDHPLRWEARHDPKIKSFVDTLEELFPKQGTSFNFEKSVKASNSSKPTKRIISFVNFLNKQDPPVCFSFNSDTQYILEVVNNFLILEKLPPITESDIAQ